MDRIPVLGAFGNIVGWFEPASAGAGCLSALGMMFILMLALQDPKTLADMAVAPLCIFGYLYLCTPLICSWLILAGAVTKESKYYRRAGSLAIGWLLVTVGVLVVGVLIVLAAI